MIREIDVEIRVRYQETDAMGFLHHANYLTYFEIGRTELLRLNGRDYRQVEEDGLYMVVVKIGSTYKLPARYDDVLTLRTRVTRITAAKIEHTYQVFRGEDLLTEGFSTLACVDRQGRVQRVPEWLRTE
jgi:acyl-CoA thioester hydrolase